MTFSRFVIFVLSKMISALVRSLIGNSREYRAFISNCPGARIVSRPTNSGRWYADPVALSPFNTRLLPILNTSPVAATIETAKRLWLARAFNALLPDSEFRRQHAGHIEHMPLVCQRIATLAAQIGWVRR